MGEKFDVKKPSNSTTSHKVKTLLVGNQNMKSKYDVGLKELKKYENKIKELETDKDKALKLMTEYKEGTEIHNSLIKVIECRNTGLEKFRGRKSEVLEQLDKLQEQMTKE